MSEETNEQQQENRDPLAGLFKERIIGAEELAAVFKFKPSWVHRQRCGDDPPPACGVGRLCFDTASPSFQAWLLKRLSAPSERRRNKSASERKGRKTKKSRRSVDDQVTHA